MIKEIKWSTTGDGIIWMVRMKQTNKQTIFLAIQLSLRLPIRVTKNVKENIEFFWDGQWGHAEKKERKYIPFLPSSSRCVSRSHKKQNAQKIVKHSLIISLASTPNIVEKILCYFD